MENASARGFNLKNGFIGSHDKRSCSLLKLSGKYRSRLEIMVLMLEAISRNGDSISFIVNYAKINHKQFKKYLNFLINTGFIDITIKNSKISYKINDKGYAFLKQYYTLIEMLSDFQTEKEKLAPFLSIIKKNTAKK